MSFFSKYWVVAIIFIAGIGIGGFFGLSHSSQQGSQQYSPQGMQQQMQYGQQNVPEQQASSGSNNYQSGNSSSGNYGGNQGSPGNYGGPAYGGDVAFAGGGGAANAGSLPACPSDNAVFDTAPMQPGDLQGIEPLGHMNGEHILPNQADHVYLQAQPSLSQVTVYAPGNVTVLQIVKAETIAGANKGGNIATVFFSPCRSLMFALQLTSLSPQLEQALSGVKPTGTAAGSIVVNTTYSDLHIAVKSGEELGVVLNNNGHGAEADFAAADVRTAPLAFIDTQEVTGMLADSYAHAVCPLDYFAASLRSALYQKLTSKNAGANGISACGAVMQDKAGTAQGNWYDKGLPTPQYQGINESALLAIAHYNLDPSQGILSVGTALIPSQFLGTQIIFTPAHEGYVNREPSEITPDGHAYCFEGASFGGYGAGNHVDIKLDSATSLEADYSSGSCTATPTLSSNTVTYER